MMLKQQLRVVHLALSYKYLLTVTDTVTVDSMLALRKQVVWNIAMVLSYTLS